MTGRLSKIIKISITLCWLILLLLIVNRDFFVSSLTETEQQVLSRAAHEHYYGIFLKDKRIGYVLEDFRPLDKGSTPGFKVVQRAEMQLKVLNKTQPIKMELKANLDSSLHLQTFQFSFSSPFYTMNATGKVTGSKVSFTLDTGQTIINDTITLLAPPLLPLNQRGYLLTQLAEPGDKLKIPFFDPLSLTARQSIITYHGREKLLLGDRVNNLHHFTESYSGMKMSFWLNDQGKIIKEKSPAGFVFLAEPKFKAVDIESSGDELLSAVAVKYKGTLLDSTARTGRFQITMPDNLETDLHGGRQQFSDGIVTMELEQFPPLALDSAGQCSADDYLQPSRYVQADHPDITALAQEIIGTETEHVSMIKLLSTWVYENIEKRPVLGLPDALTTLRNRRGDCNEHAALFAALARGVGIPTAIATGVTMYKNAFYYHAWNEICLNDQWLTLDSTTNQIPADLYHIRFKRGDMEEQMTVGALLGNLQITILSDG